MTNVSGRADYGRISWQEFKGGGDITENGKMEFVDQDKKTCSEPHRSHGSLIFRDAEPLKEGDKRFVASDLFDP